MVQLLQNSERRSLLHNRLDQGYFFYAKTECLCVPTHPLSLKESRLNQKLPLQNPFLLSFPENIAFSSSAATFIFGFAKIAETTASPSIPAVLKQWALSLLIPPITTIGNDTAVRISFNFSIDTKSASVFVPVGNIAPTPK